MLNIVKNRIAKFLTENLELLNIVNYKYRDYYKQYQNMKLLYVLSFFIK